MEGSCSLTHAWPDTDGTHFHIFGKFSKIHRQGIYCISMGTTIPNERFTCELKQKEPKVVILNRRCYVYQGTPGNVGDRLGCRYW